jgi:hypothetical protein
MVQPSITGMRQTLRHIAKHVAPNLLGGHYPDRSPGDRLDIGGDALLDPVMPILDGREAEMNHFMG